MVNGMRENKINKMMYFQSSEGGWEWRWKGVWVEGSEEIEEGGEEGGKSFFNFRSIFVRKMLNVMRDFYNKENNVTNMYNHSLSHVLLVGC